MDWLRQSGVRGKHLYLADKSIIGSGHVTMLERNSHDIAKLIATWIGA